MNMRIHQFEQSTETPNKNLQLSFLLFLTNNDNCTVYVFNTKKIDSFTRWIYEDTDRNSVSGLKYCNNFKYIKD